MEEILKEVSKKILTKEDLSFFLDQIDTAKKFIFQKIEVPLSEKIKGKVSNDFLGFIQELERKNLISKNPEKNREFFESLKENLLKIPQIKIEIAFEPRREFLKEISDFFEKNFHQKLILDVTINPEIVGGIVFEFGGKIFDFSLAKEIEKKILKIHGGV